MSFHKHSWAFVGTQEQLRVSCHGAMSTFECPWVLTVPWHHVKCVWSSGLPMSTQECSSPLINDHECSCRHAHECRWLLISIYEHSWALMITNEHSWAWCHGNILSTAPESQQMFMSAHECSWLIISVHDSSSPWFNKNQNKQGLSCASLRPP